MTYVVLFKTEAGGTSRDDYVEILQKSGIVAKVISPLTFAFINEEKLGISLKNPKDFSGIIFTSKRAVEAVSGVLKKCDKSIISEWKYKTNFAVGESTSDLARTVLDLHTVGKDCGSSEKLCSLIKSNYVPLEKPLLFPCSNKRQDTIPEILPSCGVHVEEVICYETVSNPNMRDLWENLLSDKGLPELLVFFSPSGVEFSYKMIKSSYAGDFKQLKCIAVGPTTEKTLSDLSMPVLKTAQRPSPGAVCIAVKSVLLEK
ncbi:uroporphyrinogen-III synthase-like isoform X2 [Stegodyphus dumicola]|uniref:uroporphyrinogen-III synthase-like isoform X2 n=1 Tax=Stegodyphus dumicola TaxID=202533 RepID=UPI0015B100F9|nr:uroporphyrinogen-III synthase-like isoform X2 [Stegodyphus dumicola]